MNFEIQTAATSCLHTVEFLEDRDSVSAMSLNLVLALLKDPAWESQELQYLNIQAGYVVIMHRQQSKCRNQLLTHRMFQFAVHVW